MTDTIQNDLRLSDSAEDSSKRKVTLIVICSALSFIFLIFPGFLRMYSYRNEFWISSTVYFTCVYFIGRRFPQYAGIITLAFIGMLTAMSALIVLTGSGQIPPGIIILLGFMLACVCAYFAIKSKTRTGRYIIISMSAVACLYIAFSGLDFLATRFLH